MKYVSKIILFRKTVVMMLSLVSSMMLMTAGGLKAEESSSSDSSANASSEYKSVFENTYLETQKQVALNYEYYKDYYKNNNHKLMKLDAPVNNVSIFNRGFGLGPFLNNSGIQLHFSLSELDYALTKYIGYAKYQRFDLLNASKSNRLQMLFNPVLKMQTLWSINKYSQNAIPDDSRKVIRSVEVLSAIDVFTNDIASQILSMKIDERGLLYDGMNVFKLRDLKYSIEILKKYSAIFKTATPEIVDKLQFEVRNNQAFRSKLTSNYRSEFDDYLKFNLETHPYQYRAEDFHAVAAKVDQLAQVFDIINDNQNNSFVSEVLVKHIKIRAPMYTATSLTVFMALSYLAIHYPHFNFLLTNDFLYQTIISSKVVSGLVAGLSLTTVNIFLDLRKTYIRQKEIKNSDYTQDQFKKLNLRFKGGQCQSLFM